jgi:hypothetical protein
LAANNGRFAAGYNGQLVVHVVGKGNKAAKISVRDEYIDRYLVRYRHFLNLSPLPSPQEKTPLISSLNGRGGSRIGMYDRFFKACLIAPCNVCRVKDEVKTRLINPALRRFIGYAIQLRRSTRHFAI